MIIRQATQLINSLVRYLVCNTTITNLRFFTAETAEIRQTQVVIFCFCDQLGLRLTLNELLNNVNEQPQQKTREDHLFQIQQNLNRSTFQVLVQDNDFTSLSATQFNALYTNRLTNTNVSLFVISGRISPCSSSAVEIFLFSLVRNSLYNSLEICLIFFQQMSRPGPLSILLTDNPPSFCDHVCVGYCSSICRSTEG